MDEERVYIVHLRRPRRESGEMRSDPFWEFGSFGCTRCHSRNLMHPKNAPRLAGARLAFAQGGRLGFRLILLTPPVTIERWRDRCEAKWASPEMPFRYDKAPVLIANDGSSDFPTLKQFLVRTSRTTREGAFSSRFRTRSFPLNADLSAEIVRIFRTLRAAAPPEHISTRYDQALPYPPGLIDKNRERTYRA